MSHFVLPDIKAAIVTLAADGTNPSHRTKCRVREHLGPDQVVEVWEREWNGEAGWHIKTPIWQGWLPAAEVQLEFVSPLRLVEL